MPGTDDGGARRSAQEIPSESLTSNLLEERARERLREDWPYQTPIPWAMLDRTGDSGTRRAVLDLLLLLADIGQERSHPVSSQKGQTE